MDTFKTHTPQSAAPAAKAIFTNVTDALGFLPNVLATLGQVPETAQAFVTLNQTFSLSSFSPLEREILQITASIQNKAPYCVAGHTRFAKDQGLDDKIIQTVRQGRLLADPQLRALQIFTVKMMEKKGRLSDADRTDFLGAGYSQNQMLEAVHGITFKVLTNFLSNLTTPEMDDAFKPFQWAEFVE